MIQTQKGVVSSFGFWDSRCLPGVRLSTNEGLAAACRSPVLGGLEQVRSGSCSRVAVGHALFGLPSCNEVIRIHHHSDNRKSLICEAPECPSWLQESFSINVSRGGNQFSPRLCDVLL